jgi:hypothetical protein
MYACISDLEHHTMCDIFTMIIVENKLSKQRLLIKQTTQVRQLYIMHNKLKKTIIQKQRFWDILIEFVQRFHNQTYILNK